MDNGGIMLEYLTKDDIPDSLKDIVNEIGIDSFIKLCRGCFIYIPTENSLTKLIRNIQFQHISYKELQYTYTTDNTVLIINIT